MHRAAHPERVPDCEITRRGDDDRVLRIAVTGGLSVQKGRDVIARLAALIDARRAPVQIAVFGAVEEPSILSHFACVTLAGPYESCDLKRHLAAFHPHFVFFPAVWPETWCFTLSEVWACGYPALSFDIGAIAERIRDSRAGAVLPFGLTADALLQALPDARDAVSCLFGHRFSLVAEGQIAPLKLLFSVDS
jgi:glycosyltransferase involved in cell wall biosynthesis